MALPRGVRHQIILGSTKGLNLEHLNTTLQSGGYAVTFGTGANGVPLGYWILEERNDDHRQPPRRA